MGGITSYSAVFGALGVVFLAMLFAAFASYVDRRLKLKVSRVEYESLLETLEHLDNRVSELVVGVKASDQKHRETISQLSNQTAGGVVSPPGVRE